MMCDHSISTHFPIAAEMAAAAPPPGVGCFAARAVKNLSMVTDLQGVVMI